MTHPCASAINDEGKEFNLKGKFDVNSLIRLLRNFPVRLRYRLLSAGLEPVISQTEKLCTASNY